MADIEYTFVTRANQRAVLSHPRHVPGARRETRPAHGRWTIALPDGTVYTPTTLTLDELTPREKWPEIIAKKNAEKSWLKDILPDLPGNPIEDDQGPEGTCWLHGPTRAMNAAILIATGTSYKLSANSLGIDFGWRVANGGDPSEAIAALVKNGAARWELCQPPLAADHGRWQAGWEKDRPNHRIVSGHVIDGMNADPFASRCEFAFRDIPSSVGYSRWSHELFGAVQVLDLQQVSRATVDAFAEAGGFAYVPRDVVMRPDFLGTPRFQAVDWNQWGEDTEFPANDWAPDIDCSGYIAVTQSPA